jgi:hypothetical protein
MRPQSIIIAAITLFALSGLLIGFAVGVLNRPKQTQATLPNSKGITPIATQQASPTTSPAVAPIELGCPYVGPYTVNEASGVTYTLTSYARDNSSKSTCSSNNKPIHVAGITFKLWLIQRLPDHKGITFNSVLTPKQLLNTISTPLTGKTLDLATGKPMDPDISEVQLLTFDSTTLQVQQSNTSGQVTWKYTISPSTPNGDYDLVILSDWNGQYYNWSWADIEVKKGSN